MLSAKHSDNSQKYWTAWEVKEFEDCRRFSEFAAFQNSNNSMKCNKGGNSRIRTILRNRRVPRTLRTLRGLRVLRNLTTVRILSVEGL